MKKKKKTRQKLLIRISQVFIHQFTLFKFFLHSFAFSFAFGCSFQHFISPTYSNFNSLSIFFLFPSECRMACIHFIKCKQTLNTIEYYAILKIYSRHYEIYDAEDNARKLLRSCIQFSLVQYRTKKKNKMFYVCCCFQFFILFFISFLFRKALCIL